MGKRVLMGVRTPKKKSTSRRRVKSTKTKKGKTIKYKYPNQWGVSRTVPVAGRDLRLGDADLKRIDALGSYDFVTDPVTGKKVTDAYVENPPRPDKN